MAMHTLLPFELGAQKLLVEARWVSEIVGSVEVIDVPLTSKELPGVFLWNGHAVPMIDLETCLGLQKKGKASRARTIVARVSGELVGLAVDSVGEVTLIDEAKLADMRILSIRFATAEVDSEEGLAAVIDLPQLVTHVLRTALERSA